MPHGAWGHNTICELVLIGQAAGQTIVNVHAFEAATAEEALFIAPLSDNLADASAQALRDDWITNMLTAYKACHGTLYNLVTVGSQVVERPALVSHRLGRQDRTNAPLPAAGTFATAGGMEDPQVAAVIKWRSLVASRHARGRTYIGGLSQDATDVATPGTLTATFQANLATYASQLSARYKPTGAYPQWNLTVYSRPYNSPHGDYAKRVGGALIVVPKGDYNGDSNFVTSYAVDPVTRSQRRRERGVGI